MFCNWRKVSENVVTAILESKNVGNAQLIKFTDERLVTGAKSFFDLISKNNIDTGMKKKKKETNEVSLLKEDRQAFGLLISKVETLEEAFKYPLTTVPLSIADTSTSLRQGDKVAFRNYLIDNSNASVSNFLPCATWIYDGMAIIRSAKPKTTFGEFLDQIISSATPPKHTLAKSIEIIMDCIMKIV